MSLLFAELEKKQGEIKDLQAFIAAQREQIDELKKQLFGVDRTRREYPEGDQSICAKCHKVGPLKARGLCPRCYSKFYKTQKKGTAKNEVREVELLRERSPSSIEEFQREREFVDDALKQAWREVPKAKPTP